MSDVGPGAPQTETLREISAKESRDGSLHSPMEGCKGLVPCTSACKKLQHHVCCPLWLGEKQSAVTGGLVCKFQPWISQLSWVRPHPESKGLGRCRAEQVVHNHYSIHLRWGNWLLGALAQADITPNSSKQSNNSWESLISNCPPTPVAPNTSITGSPGNCRRRKHSLCTWAIPNTPCVKSRFTIPHTTHGGALGSCWSSAILKPLPNCLPPLHHRLWRPAQMQE